MSEKQISYDPLWTSKYDDMIVTAEKAVQHIKPGNHVFVGTGGAHPQALTTALVARASTLADVQIIQMLTLGDAPYAAKNLTEHFVVNSFFISDNVREIIQEGVGDYTPIFLSEIPNLFSSGVCSDP